MKRILPAILLLSLILGCSSNDDRLIKMATDHEGRQAEQNLRMADLEKQIAEGSKKLVEADAESRDKFLTIENDLRADQATVGVQRDALEADRRAIAEQRGRDPIVAASILQVGLYVACLLPLLLAGYLVYAMRSLASVDDAIVTEFLVTELVAEHPLLLEATTQPQLLSTSESATAEQAAA